MKKPKTKMGFQQALKYLLDVLCFAYYVKHNNLVSDKTFDELEDMWKKLFNERTAPMRAMERGFLYSTGVHVVYDEYMRIKEKKKYRDIVKKTVTNKPVLYNGKKLSSYPKAVLEKAIVRLAKKNQKLLNMYIKERQRRI